MFPSKAILSLIVSSLVIVDAIPLSRRTSKTSTLSFSTRIKTDAPLGSKNGDHRHKRSTPLTAANTGMYYTTEVGVGIPPTYYTLMVDTGSSDTWIGAPKPYVPTCTGHDTGKNASVSYGTGHFSGEEWTDTVTLGSDLVIENQSIGIANSTSGFSNIDGILGLGPVDLTRGSVRNTSTVPTVMDNLFSQHKISQEVLGVYFVPVSEPISNGSLTFGGIDNSVITSQVEYVPVTTANLSSYYWGIEGSISYGGTTQLPLGPGFVDTGSTLIEIASDAFQQYQNATGAILDPITNLYTITPEQYANLKTFSFNFGGKPYDLSANAQIWPRSLNSLIGGNSTSIYLAIHDLGMPSGSGINFVLGYAFLQRYYSVFDTTNHRVGFASTAYTNATTN